MVITELRDSTYYAEIHLTQNGRSFSISSRPSDAMRTAVCPHCLQVMLIPLGGARTAP